MARPKKQNRFRARRDSDDHKRTQPSTPRPRGPRAVGRGAGFDRDSESTAEQQHQRHYRNGGGGGGGGSRKNKRGSLHQGSRKPRGEDKQAASSGAENGRGKRSKQQNSSRKTSWAVDIGGNTAPGADATRPPPTPCTNCEALQLHNQQLYESISDVIIDWAREVGVDTDGDRDATASVDTEEMEWQREHVFIIPADHRKVTDSELLSLENARLGLAAARGLARPVDGCHQSVHHPWGQAEALAAPAPAIQYRPMDISGHGLLPDHASQWLIQQGMISPISEPRALQLLGCSSRMQLSPVVDAAISLPPPPPPLPSPISVPKSFVRQRF